MAKLPKPPTGTRESLTRDSVAWLRRELKKISTFVARPDTGKISLVTSRVIGSLVMFGYDPKLKARLPYYDRYPLVFVTDMRRDGFLGLNVHYLPPELRSRLMDALWELAPDNSKITERTRLALSYRALKGAAASRWFRPCVKQYLSRHVTSEIRLVSPLDWNRVVMLPTQRFKGADSERVWADSRGRM